MSSLRMYIPIRDETNFMIKYYQYLYNEYWQNGPDVYFLGYKKPESKLDKNVHFISLADKRDPSPKAWSNNLIDYFEAIDEEFFYFSMEDQLIIRPVDTAVTLACEKAIDQNIGRVDMSNSVQFDPARSGWVRPFKEIDGVKFLIQHQSPPPNVYRVSCSNSIWNRKWFLKTLERNWSTYDWETLANDGRNNNDGYDVISTVDRWAPPLVHSLCKHWRGLINIDGLLPKDEQKLIELSTETEKEKLVKITWIDTITNLEGHYPNHSIHVSNV